MRAALRKEKQALAKIAKQKAKGVMMDTPQGKVRVYNPTTLEENLQQADFEERWKTAFEGTGETSGTEIRFFPRSFNLRLLSGDAELWETVWRFCFAPGAGAICAIGLTAAAVLGTGTIIYYVVKKKGSYAKETKKPKTKAEKKLNLSPAIPSDHIAEAAKKLAHGDESDGWSDGFNDVSEDELDDYRANTGDDDLDGYSDQFSGRGSKGAVLVQARTQMEPSQKSNPQRHVTARSQEQLDAIQERLEAIASTNRMLRDNDDHALHIVPIRSDELVAELPEY